MRRRLLLIVTILAMLTVAVPLWTWWSRTEPIRVYERIHVGMTLAEVEAVIGRPPGDPFDTTPNRLVIAKSGFSWHARDSASPDAISWVWADYLIEVYFDHQGTVMRFCLFERSKRGWFRRLLDGVGF